MAEQLADQLLSAQFLGRPPSKAKIQALIKACSLLEEYGRAAPPLLSRIMHQDREQEGPKAPDAHDEAEIAGIERLAQSLRPRQGQKDQ
ncbi:hypothetical protein [Methylobacterium iners]|uniref:Uncharacterized protein n=1 Tax=Methylobacterium iners TaxID=418707 RepID=A0ABQ4S441_9HYPH|nr:hypothetical protein [Methylobacterium iners]GJD96917.1 hypothetical protein OCOJLMKI_4144 [Methylobacterium iners]